MMCTIRATITATKTTTTAQASTGEIDQRLPRKSKMSRSSCNR